MSSTSTNVTTDNGQDITLNGVTFHNFGDAPSDGNFFSYMMNPNTTYLEGSSFDFVERKNVSLYYYDLHTLIPNKSVRYNIICLAEDKSETARIEGIIEGKEYQEWGQNDQYIVSLIRTKVMELKNKK